MRRTGTKSRLTLFRTCHTCGRKIVTTAATPFIRQLYNVDGKRQKTCYFCSEACKRASYTYRMDGKAEECRKAREASRDISEKNRRYYESHAEQERARARERYWADPERARADVKYQRRKQRLMEAVG